MNYLRHKNYLICDNCTNYYILLTLNKIYLAGRKYLILVTP